MPGADEIILQLRANNEELKSKLTDAQKKIESFEKGGNQSVNKLSDGFKSLVGIIGGYFSVQAIKSLMETSGAIETVKASFEGLTAGVKGGSKGLLESIKTASQGTVSELDIMKNANLAISLMGQDVAQNLPRMMEIAKATARQQGVEVQQMFADIIVASGRRSVMILDNLGISSVTAGRYQEEYARKLGKTALQMTDTEKSAAFFYAVMKAGGETIDKSGQKTLTLGERLQVAKASMSGMIGTLAEKLTPSFTALVDSFNRASVSGGIFAKVISYVAAPVNFLIRGIANLVLMLQRFSTAGDIEKLQDRMDKLAESMKKQAGNPERVALLRNKYNELYGEIKKLHNQEIQMASDMEKNTQSALSGIDDEIKKTKELTVAKKQNTTTIDSRPLLEYSAYLDYIGEKEVAEFYRLKEELDKLNKDYSMSTEQRMSLATAYHKKLEELEAKHTTARIAFQDAAYGAAKSAMGKIDEANKQLIYNMVWGKGGWEEYKKQMKEIFKSLIADILYLIMKALIAQAILAGLGVGPMGAGVVTRFLFKEGHVPVFRRGRVPWGEAPVYAGGDIPSDHFPAYIGTGEAVINERSTRANADLLRAINDGRGQRMVGGDTTILNINGAIVDGEKILQIVDTQRENKARRLGTTNYPRASVY